MAGDSEDDSSASPARALADAPAASDPIERDLVRTRVAAGLFEQPADPVMVGRFHVLERIGRGGMGRVYAAYDPDLDRRIALKLVRADDGGTRDRLLGEAQALARLSHPNVVPVHDVEVIGDEICIVMEFVRGQTVRAWRSAAPRSWREVLGVYRQVGEGLEAAHAAGLVHRDVKPDNAIVGADGRVRVVDFGLARPMVATAAAASPGGEPTAAVTTPAGTPRYMAPEQAAGGAVAAAADQYAFCVALREALGDAAPWLAPALDRGTAADPTARFASMSELLRALARDPAAIRRRRLLAAAAAVVLAGAGAIAGAVWAGRAPAVAPVAVPVAAIEPCSGGTGEIAAVWNLGKRAALARQLASAGAYGAASAPRLLGALDGYAQRWAASHRAACLAHRRGEHTGDLLDRRMACLARSRSALAAALEVLPPRADVALPEASLAVAALPALEACDDLARLLGAAPPPAAIAGEVARLDGELARAAVLLEAGRPDEARDIAGAAVNRARRIDHAPVLARGLVSLGRAAMALEPRRRAVAPLREATAVALRTGDDALAVEAYARRAWIEGMDDHGGDILDGLAVVEALAERIPEGGFVRALLHNNVAAVEWGAGHRDRADAAMQRALTEAGAVPEPAPIELLRIRGNLAIHVADPARRDAVFAATVAALTARLGDDHPTTLEARFRAAQLLDDPARASAALAPVCATYQRMHPGHGDAIAGCWFELGWLAYHAGDAAGAVRALTTAAETPGAEPERAVMTRGYLALARGEPAQAVRAFDAVLAALPGNGPWWSQLFAGDARLGRGLARRAAGDRRGAAADLATAERLLAPVLADQPYPYIAWRVARVRAARAEP